MTRPATAGRSIRDRTTGELLKQCAEQDAAAWNELIRRHRSLVWSVPLRLGLAEPEAAEVFQDVFESLMRNVGSLQEGERLSSWLYTAARRLSLRRLARRRKEHQREEHDEALMEALPEAGPSHAERLAEAELTGTVLRLLETMAPRCRDLLQALFLDPEEPDYDQIAARLGIPRGSIGPTRLRCLKKLHDDLQEQHRRPGGP